MAELVLKYPDRFAGAVACLPMNNVDASIKEIEREAHTSGLTDRLFEEIKKRKGN